MLFTYLSNTYTMINMLVHIEVTILLSFCFKGDKNVIICVKRLQKLLNQTIIKLDVKWASFKIFLLS